MGRYGIVQRYDNGVIGRWLIRGGGFGYSRLDTESQRGGRIWLYLVVVVVHLVNSQRFSAYRPRNHGEDSLILTESREREYDCHSKRFERAKSGQHKPRISWVGSVCSKESAGFII